MGSEMCIRDRHSAVGRDAVALWWDALCTTRRERFPVIPICSSTSKIDDCTETHINRRYARTGKAKYIAIKSHREPPVFAREGQNGLAQAETPGAEARISPCVPAPVILLCPAKNGATLAANLHAVRGPQQNGKWGVLAADYSVFIPVCLPWGIIPNWSEVTKKKC